MKSVEKLIVNQTSLQSKLTDLIDSYHAALAYTRKQINHQHDLKAELEAIDAAMSENNRRQFEPPRNLLMDMSLQDIKDFTGLQLKAATENELLNKKQWTLQQQIASAERDISTLSLNEWYANRDIWLAVYQHKVDTLKQQNSELFHDLAALINRLQKTPSDFLGDLLPDVDTSRIDRMATELGGLPL